MPRDLQRFQQAGQSHFVTFSCYHRHSYFNIPELYDRFVEALEDMRRRFQLCIYGYVVMPEHVHLLLSEPPQVSLAEAMHYLKLSFARRVSGDGDRGNRIGVDGTRPRIPGWTSSSFS
jgi:putative transposase